MSSNHDEKKQDPLSTDILWDLIKNALNKCIKAHGPITKEFLGSAVKRVAEAIVKSPELQEATPMDVWDKMTLNTTQIVHKNQISFLKKRLNTDKNIQEIQRLRSELAEALITVPAKQAWIDGLRATIMEINEEKIKLKKELRKFENTEPAEYKAKKKSQMLHQLTNKLARLLWEINGQRDGHAEQDWLLAEKIAEQLLLWKPNGKDTYYVYV